MRIDQFDYIYPDSLVATEPKGDFRILLNRADSGVNCEITNVQLFDLFEPGDVLVINNTRVERRRVLTNDGYEILFCEPVSESANSNGGAGNNNKWHVLFAARDLKIGAIIDLPGGLKAELVAKGLPQTLKLSAPIDATYFENHGDLALPPYIQKARGERVSRKEDEKWYQTAWAEQNGSQAAPTASLHFSNEDLQTLRNRGVIIAPLTLHVGIGTFLPVKTELLNDHKMHHETVEIPPETVEYVTKAKCDKKKVWALGTTVVRSLESWATGKLHAKAAGQKSDGATFSGSTDLFIMPGYKYEVVDALMTNFHQPRTTLLALVAAFAGRENMLRAYQYAIEKQFRLFSYGDLSVWLKE